jgi:hypothetical protein
MLTILRKVVMSIREGAIKVLYHFRYLNLARIDAYVKDPLYHIMILSW